MVQLIGGFNIRTFSGRLDCMGKGLSYLGRGDIEMFSSPLSKPESGCAERGSTQLLAKYSKSKPVGSPACLPGRGIRRAVRGLSSRKAREPKSSRTA